MKIFSQQVFLAGVTSVFLLFSTSALAGQLDIFNGDGWMSFAIDEEDTTEDYVGPGWGGQAFDAEYLFWKQDGSILSIGLQTGFDVQDGLQKHRNEYYWTGDIALGINNVDYGYAIDFGLPTAGYSVKNNKKAGSAHKAGVYEVSSWNNDIAFGDESAPFSMAGWTQRTDLKENDAGLEGNSYYRIVSFDLAAIYGPLSQSLTIAAHWTISCGNDAISGTFNSLPVPEGTPVPSPVPEPATMLLFGIGLAGLGGFAKRRIR